LPPSYPDATIGGSNQLTEKRLSASASSGGLDHFLIKR